MLTFGISDASAEYEITLEANNILSSVGEIIAVTGNIAGASEGQGVVIEIKDLQGQTIVSETVITDSNGDFKTTLHISPSKKSSAYDVIANAIVDGQTIIATQKISGSPKPTQTPPQSGGCLIATATYGSELAKEVQELREIRDNMLLKTSSGSAFLDGFNTVYYSFSPTIAIWENENPAFKDVVKLAITPLISTLSILNYVNVDSEAEMLGYGIAIILLNVSMYFIAPVFAITKIRYVLYNKDKRKNHLHL